MMRTLGCLGHTALWGIIIFAAVCATWQLATGHLPPGNFLWTYAWIYFGAVGFLIYVAIDVNVGLWKDRKQRQRDETKETAENVRRLLEAIRKNTDEIKEEIGELEGKIKEQIRKLEPR
jgi:hypothetical protein